MNSEEQSEPHNNRSGSTNRQKASRERFIQKNREQQELKAHIENLIEGNRKALSRAITLVESSKPSDHKTARQIIESCLPHTGNAIRIGITGVPGVGKSTFIDRLGRRAIHNNHRLAVLTIDPSSSRSGGSILGDKTRMGQLATQENVFIRPSPTGGSLGGVARKTRETMLLCEAAGYDRIFIETVGVGQSETAVRSMVDCFLLLTMPGSGDELQGIKRGIIEMADLMVINKAEDPESKPIRQALSTYKSAIKMLPSPVSGWKPQILTCSALKNDRIDDVWEEIQSFMKHIQQNNYIDRQRREQVKQWMYETLDQQLKDDFYEHPEIQQSLEKAEQSVLNGEKTAYRAARELLEKYRSAD